MGGDREINKIDFGVNKIEYWLALDSILFILKLIMSKPPPAFDALREEDWAFLKRFLLASGSLKDLAKAYGVSYPTIRQRLDRLIEKVRLHDAAMEMAPFERSLRGLLADGRLDSESFRLINAAHQEALAEAGAGAPVRPPARPSPPPQPEENDHESDPQQPGESSCDYQPA